MATGLAFSVSEGCGQPRSLHNILRARETDLGLPIPASGSLEPWAENGVLLLNKALTVRRAEAKSHRRYWKPFTEAIMRVVIESVHPAAWSTGTEPRFIDSRPLSRADDGLRALASRSSEVTRR